MRLPSESAASSTVADEMAAERPITHLPQHPRRGRARPQGPSGIISQESRLAERRLPMIADTREPARATEQSAWAPFRHTAFTVIWIALLVANVGTWMYNGACGWLMTSLDPDPLTVSLVQVATTQKHSIASR